MEDQRIVELLWQRDDAALAELARKYGGYCFSIAGSILPRAEDVKEVVNDAYLGVWNAIPPHRPEKLSAFLGKIVRRLALRRLRFQSALKRAGNEAAVSLDELENCIPSGVRLEERLERAELTAAIERFLETLAPDERRVFLRRYWFFDPIAAICARYGYSQSKVKSMLMRTRRKLSEFLRREGIL